MVFSIGDRISSVSFPVEVSKTMELARALHDDDLVYVAGGDGFDGIPVPLTITALAAHWSEGGALGNALALGLDVNRLLHGETTWEYFVPVRVGDHLDGETILADLAERQGKRGGLMKVVTLQTDYRNQHGALVIRQSDVLIESGPR